MDTSAAQRLSHLLEPAPLLSTAEKLRVALNLAQAGLAMKRQSYVRKYPTETSEQISKRLLEWQCKRVEAPFGDCPGTPKALS